MTDNTLINIIIVLLVFLAIPSIYLSCKKSPSTRLSRTFAISVMFSVALISFGKRMYILPVHEFVSIKSSGEIANIKFLLLTHSILKVDLCAYSAGSDPKIDSMFWIHTQFDSTLCKWEVKTVLTSGAGQHLDSLLSGPGHEKNEWPGTSINRLVCRTIWLEERGPGIYNFDITLTKPDPQLSAVSGFVRVFQLTY